MCALMKHCVGRLWEEFVFPVSSGVLWEDQCGHLPSHRPDGGPGASAAVRHSYHIRLDDRSPYDSTIELWNFWMCIQGCSWKLRFGRVVEWSACRWCNINHCFRKRNPMAALGRALCVCWDKSVSFINLSFVFVFVLQNVKHPCLFSWICSDQKPNRGSEEVRGCLASNTLMHLTCPVMLHATQHVKKQINNGEKCIIKQVLYRT